MLPGRRGHFKPQMSLLSGLFQARIAAALAGVSSPTVTRCAMVSITSSLTRWVASVSDDDGAGFGFGVVTCDGHIVLRQSAD